MDRPAHPRQNRLLANLPDDVYESLCPHLQLVPLSLGSVLHESGVRLRHVYFPTSAIASVLCMLENGGSTETAMVGNEGMLGVTLFMGSDTTPSRTVVENPGFSYRMSARALQIEFNKAGPLQQLLLRYAQALFIQIAQTAVCNRHHRLDQQFCRRLLTCLDRLDSQEVNTTHELIAAMLGVRREGISDAAGKLQRAGLIQCRRGHITVLDRHGLENRSCECYAVVKKEFQRLLPERPNAMPGLRSDLRLRAANGRAGGEIDERSVAAGV